MNQWVSDLLPYVVSLVTGFIGWLTGRGRRKEEIHTAEMDNVAKAVTIWRDTAETLETRLVATEKSLIELTKRFSDLEKDHMALKKESNRLLEKNNKLMLEIKRLQEENIKLKNRE